MGYGGNLDPTLTNAATRLASSFGTMMGSLGAFPALDAVRQALPMIHAFTLMAVVILIPLIVIMSGYSLKTLIVLTFAQTALVSLIFWWELARWLDSWLLSVLYNSSTHERINPYFFENTQDDIIVNFVMGALFIILPVIWFGTISWAGIKVGDFANSFRQGVQDVKSKGSSGGNILNSIKKM